MKTASLTPPTATNIIFTQTLAATLPEDTHTPTPTYTPSLPSQPDNGYSAAVEIAKVWDQPQHEGDYWSLHTELIIGEHVVVLQKQGEWSQVVAVEQPSSKDVRGYPGWVRSGSLAKGWPQAKQYALVMVSWTNLRESQAADSKVVMRLYLDARLPVMLISDQWVQVQIPDGRQGWVAGQDVRITEHPNDPYLLDSFFATAESLVGVPYVWGGTSSSSYDCSGFLYRLFHAYGFTLARDANDEILSGTDVDKNHLQRGNLIFTANSPGGKVTHVLMYWGNGQVIDAEPGRGVSIHLLSEWMKTAFWSGAKTFLP